MSFPSLNTLLNTKPEIGVTEVTIESFASSDKSLKTEETPLLSGGSPNSFLTNTPRLLDEKIDKKLHRRSQSDNSLGNSVKMSNGSPLKSPSALEAVRLLAKTHTSEKRSESPSGGNGFKISNLFWSLEDPLPKTSNSYSSSVLFSGWNNSYESSAKVGGKVFKIPLSQAVENSMVNKEVPLPAVVIRCIEYLDNEGLNEVGLYRIPGSTSLVGQLKAKFDSGQDCLLNEDSPDPHAVATLFKLFLRELPETILTKKALTQTNHFLASTNVIDSSEKPLIPSHIDNRGIHLAEQIKLLLQDIPNANYYLLHWTFRHLSRIVQNSSINKMNLSNLGVIFCPTLAITSKLFRILVEYNELIFPLPRPPFDQSSKKPSPRPYSISSVQTNNSTDKSSNQSSINSLSNLLKLKQLDCKYKSSPLKTDNNKIETKEKENKNTLLFENLAALSEMLKFGPGKTEDKDNSINGSQRSRNSIISYQSSPRVRRSQSIDSPRISIIDDNNDSSNDLPSSLFVQPEKEYETKPKVMTEKDRKNSSPGILHLDYYDGHGIAQALLNMKTRRNQSSINRQPIQKSNFNLLKQQELKGSNAENGAGLKKSESPVSSPNISHPFKLATEDEILKSKALLKKVDKEDTGE
ncbi:RhoGAP-domain-containing protein [Neoconidiobolus thromboides FSU 785]|nr:RhoGAP-domain-containing protein [Neoconidiobolus thromboides FSU 785]